MNTSSLKEQLSAHKKVIYIIGGICLVGVIAHSAYNIFHKPVVEKTIPLVRTTTIGSTSTENSYTYPGEVRGKYESNLAFQVAGKIVSRSVNLGDTVTAGQVLMTIDPKDVQQSVNASQAAVNSATSNFKLAQDMYARYAKLYSEGAVSEAMRDQYRTQYEAASATLAQAQAQLTANTNQLNYTRLVADHHGVVASVGAEVGQVVAAGTPVVSVVQSGNREIQIFVPEGRLNTIAPGMPCTVTFWALNNTVVNGNISEISPMADQATKTYKVRVALSNMPSEARLGMTAKVSLNEGKTNEILLPRSAIYQTGSTPQVWIVRNNKVSLINVQAKGYKDDKVVITKGLQKGDVVVTAGINKLSNNMEVRLEGGATK